MELEKLQGIYNRMIESVANEGLTPSYIENINELAKYIDEIKECEKREKNEIAELALNYWRLSNWVERANSDRKSIAFSALRKISAYLDNLKVSLIDLSGKKYDDGYAADVIGVDSEKDVPDEELIVKEMVKPIILYKGSVLRYGQVVLGDEEDFHLTNNATIEKQDEGEPVSLIQKDGYEKNQKEREKWVDRNLNERRKNVCLKKKRKQYSMFRKIRNKIYKSINNHVSRK